MTLMMNRVMMAKSFGSVAAFVAVMMLVACSDDALQGGTVKGEFVGEVRVAVEDFVTEGAETRSSYTIGEDKVHFTWAKGDTLGIYPKDGDQVCFPISSGDGNNTAVFDGGAWRLRSDREYAAYYPFSKDFYTLSPKALPVVYTGQKQKENDNTEALGAYDFMACAPCSTESNGCITFQMKHLGVLTCFELTLPEACEAKSLVLTCGEDVFVEEGKYNLTVAKPVITPTKYSNTFSMELEDIATTESNKVISVYAMMAPMNLSGKGISILLLAEGKRFLGEVQGKEMVADKSYKYTASLTREYESVDLGMDVVWATCNVGASKMEECGSYFAWGAKSAGTSFDWSNCPYWTKTDVFSKYTTHNACSSTSKADGKDKLEEADDVANVLMGNSWRMPTKKEWEDLIGGCTWKWTAVNGVYGYMGTETENGGTIFFPASGYYDGSGIGYKGTAAYYWTSSLYEGTDDNSAYSVFFNSTLSPQKPVMSNMLRYKGVCVRAVRDKSTKQTTK